MGSVLLLWLRGRWESNKKVLDTVPDSLDYDTVEILNCTSVHFHCNEPLFPGEGKKTQWPKGGVDRHMQPHRRTQAERVKRALAVSCW